jgi:PAS domain S-box-containing protein
MEEERVGVDRPPDDEIRLLRSEVAALRGRNAALEAALEQMDEAFFVKDREGRYQAINSAGAGRLGRSPREVVGKVDAELFSPEAARRIVEADRRVIAEGASLTYEEVATAAGVTRTYRSTKWPYRDERGEVVGLIGVARDITEPRRAEEELRETREFLSRLLDHSPAHIHVTDRERLCLVNLACEEPVGLRREQIIGRRFEDVYPPEQAARFREQNRRVFEAEAPLEYEEDLDARDGRRHFYTVKFPLRDAAHRVVAVGGISIDITDRKRAERALRGYADRLKVLSRRVVEVQEEERRHLARELHDEIGQSLTAIAVNLQTIRRSCGPEGRPRLDECLGVVQRSIEQVRSLALDLRPSMLDDLGLVAALRWYLDGQARRVGYEARFVARPGEIRLGPASATIAFRVAQEALTNVARHARARRVLVKLWAGGGRLRLIVRDDGVGFDPEAVLRRVSEGGGLGLLGMRERAALLGGRVDFRSAGGRGTEVRLTLPTDRDEEGA